MAPLRALLDDPDFGEACVFCGNAEPVRRAAGGCVHAPDYLCEPAGAAFAARFDYSDASQSACGGRGRGAGRRDNGDSDSEAGEEYGRSGKGGVKATGFLKMSERIKGLNLYDLLAVSEGASQDEIRKAYRSLALTAHPDKQASANEEDMKLIQERFVQLQEAYELLSDPAKRLQYDSSLDFDDSLPRFRAGVGEDFFEVFSEVFKRNARFSMKRPVPDVGGPDARPEEWKRFYTFWHEFQSWRDPVVLAQLAGEDICDLNDAECREERRWMQRENERVAKKYKQAERDRISELVRMAEKFDPRIQAEKDAKKAARQAEATRRAEEMQAAQRAKDEAERVRREEEEAAKAAEAERRREEKAVREAVKTEVKKARQRLRSFHPAVRNCVLMDQLNEVCLRLEEPELRRLGDDVEKALKGGVAQGAAVFHKAIESIGLKPVLTVKDEDTASTSSGPSQSSSHEKEDPEVLRKRAQENQRREAKARDRREREEAAAAEERAKREAEKVEERKRKEELRRKEQQQADAMKRQQEKKEDQKAKKAEEKKKKDEEQEVKRREQQREEAKQKALEQAEADRQAATARKQEMEMERQVQLFTADRLERLLKLDPMPDEELSQQLRAALGEDASLAGALRALKDGAEELEDEAVLDRLMALVYKVGYVWPLALPPPVEIRLPNAVRNRVKKARQRLRDVAAAFLAEALFRNADATAATEWQAGIVDGSEEVPVWSIEEHEAEERAAKEAAQQKAAAAAEEAKGKKGKKAKDAKTPKGEDEDIDRLLAELDAAPADSKKAGKKKK